MEKTEWPTKERLEELRESGQIAQSKISIHCAGAAGVLAGVLLIRERFVKFLVGAVENAVRGDQVQLSTDLALLFLVPLGFGVVFSLFCGLIQNRFLFRPSTVSPDIERLNPGRVFSLASIFGGVVRDIAVLLVASLLALVALRISSRELFTVFTGERAQAMGVLSHLFSLSFGVSIAVLFGAAGVFFLLSRFWFMWTHRMSRAEIEADSRADTGR